MATETALQVGDDVEVALSGVVISVEPGRLALRAKEGGAVWVIAGAVLDVPVGSSVVRHG